MSNLVPFLKKCLGLNNVKKKTDFFIGENGELWAAKLINADISDDGGLELRAGYASVLSGNCKDIHGFNNVLWFVKDGLLSSYDGELEIFVKAGDVYYADDGVDLYCLVGSETFKLSPGSVDRLLPTSQGREQTPTSYGEDSIEYFKVLGVWPANKFLTIWHGRAWSAKDGVLWYSEIHNYASCNIARNWFELGGSISGIKGIRTGLYIGSSTGMYYLHGDSPKDFSPNQLDVESVIPGSMVVIDGTLLKGLNLFEKIVLYATVKGFRAVGPDGFYIELNEDNLAIPYGRGTGFIHNKKYYLSLDG